MQAHEIKPQKKSRKRKKRVGRGNASGHGTTATRGTKGQRARSGGRSGLKRLGFRFILRRTPKLKGFVSLKAKAAEVGLDAIFNVFENDAKITPAALIHKHLIPTRADSVKIFAGKNNRLVKKLIIEGCRVSAGAKAIIEKAGGTVK